MTVERGSFSTGGTGNTTVILNTTGFTPVEITFFVGPAGTSDTDDHTCIGYMTSSQQQALSSFNDSTGKKTALVNNKCISHYTRVSGTLTEIIAATKVSIDLEEFTINFSAHNSSYPIYFIARG